MDSPTTRDEAIALGGLAVLTGAGVVLVALMPKSGGSQLKPGETMSNPIVTLAAGQITLPRGTAFTINNPQVQYSGPGRNTYTYLQIKQGNVTVYGSGVAAVFVGPASVPTNFPLVSPTQIQPDGTVGPLLTAFDWATANTPGSTLLPICGAPPNAGPGDLHVQIYQDSSESGNPADANGLSSPTCNARLFLREVIFPAKILFT